MITLVKYGLGNIQAFVNIYKQLNIPVRVAQTAEELAGAERLILPGVGSFDAAMERLSASGMRERLDHLVLEEGRPILGVCVGMQMMARGSEEGVKSGLRWIDGEVKRFDATSSSGTLHLPHMGWNDVIPVPNAPLFRDITDPRFYFLHSYYFSTADSGDDLSTTDYGGQFVSSVRHKTIYGTQFHPEKSHHWGVQLLKNFAEL